LVAAREIGLKIGLKYVYTGNIPGDPGEKTFCWRCGKLVIDRWGFKIHAYPINQGRCKYCDTPIDGVEM
jgi:pyruvate formate lyase activating enzyme